MEGGTKKHAATMSVVRRRDNTTQPGDLIKYDLVPASWLCTHDGRWHGSLAGRKNEDAGGGRGNAGNSGRRGGAGSRPTRRLELEMGSAMGLRSGLG